MAMYLSVCSISQDIQNDIDLIDALAFSINYYYLQPLPYLFHVLSITHLTKDN